jgi:alkanesulfonate monooxygenase SsuD/methylene tetrahydromethanopterin reductase-like flavin-dependent oxidoreductase (luciferase family)
MTVENSDLKFGYNISGLSSLDSVKAGIIAEKHGFDSVWIPDHLIDMDGAFVDPWSVMAGIGIQTRRVMIFTGVTDTQRSHPAKTAQSVATVDELSHGRAGLGIGAGEAMNITPFGIHWDKNPRDRTQRLREAIKVIRLLWSSSKNDRKNYEGKFFQLKDAWLDQHPVQKPSPPIYVGAFSSTRMLKLTGEMGDGWYPWLVTPETYVKRREKIMKAAIEAGRNTEEIDAVATVYTAITEDPKIQRELTESTKVEVLTTDQTGLKSFGVELHLPKRLSYQHIGASDMQSPILEDLARQIPEDVVKRYAAIGDIDECIGFIEEFIKAGAKHISIYDLMTDVKGPAAIEKTLKAYGKKIIPYFKEY